MKQINRRRFMKFTGLSLGIGTLYRVIPALGADSALGGFLADMRRSNGESISPFTFIQLSDSHVGFNGHPKPTGTAVFERGSVLSNRPPRQSAQAPCDPIPKSDCRRLRGPSGAVPRSDGDLRVTPA